MALVQQSRDSIFHDGNTPICYGTLWTLTFFFFFLSIFLDFIFLFF